MTREPDDLQRYLDDFAGRVHGAQERSTGAHPPRRRLALAGASAVAIAAAAVVLVVGWGGGVGDRLDIVAEARAALSPPGEIVHMVIRHESPPGDRASWEADGLPGPLAPPSITEQWTAVDPPRWRFVQVLPPPEDVRGTIGDAQGPISGRHEVSYANGVQKGFIAQRNTLEVQKGFSDDGAAAQPPGFFGVGGDPQADLQAMLASGEVTDAGERQVGGRTVRRLVSEKAQGTIKRRLVYEVDADTFVPVQGTFTIFLGPGSELREISERFVVQHYERIPLTPRTAKLLTIDTNLDTKVTVRTAEDLRRRQEEIREAAKRCSRQADGDTACPAPPPILVHPRSVRPPSKP